MQPQPAHTGLTGGNAQRECTANMLQSGVGCGGPPTPTTSTGVTGFQGPSGRVASDASQALSSAADLNMLLKLIQTYLPNGVPKMEMGDLATRPSRLIIGNS